MADTISPNDKKTIDQIKDLNKNLNDLLKSESSALDGDMLRSEKILSLHNKYNEAIKQDGYMISSSKSNGINTYNYLASAVLGNGYNDFNLQSRLQKSKSKNKNIDNNELINRARLEKLFTSGDTQMASYFMSNASDEVRIYDEIDSICGYIYQLEEAINVIRDNVLTSEEVSEEISMDIKFSGISEDTSNYVDVVKTAMQYQNFDKKLKDHIVPKAIKYGRYYTIIIPYSEIGIKMMQSDLTHTRNVFESGTELDEVMSEVTSIFESVDVGADNQSNNSKKKQVTLSPDLQFQVDTIKENLNSLYICEDASPINITGIDFRKFGNMSEDMQKAVDKAIKYSFQNGKKSDNKPNKEKTFADATYDPNDFYDIKGCYIKLADPRQLRPIKIFDYIIGYYYFENYDYEKMGTSLTDMMSNQMNFNQRTLVIDNIVNSVLKNLKYGDVVAGDNQLKNMIMNCIFYAERRDSPIRIKFLPPEYVVPFETNTDEYGNGQPVLLRSLFYGRLYASLLLFNITAIITKSTDSEFYYLKQNALDQQFSNQVSDLIDQFNDNNIDPIQIINGNILHGNRAINKRYYLSMGTSDIRPVDMEVVSGQNIDIHNDFMNDLKKMAIGSTGVPAVMIDFIDEVEYATMLGMANIKNLKRCNSIQTDFNPSITRALGLICKYTSNSIPENILSTLVCTLRKSKTINNTISSNQVNDVFGLAETMVKTWLKGNDTNPPEIQAFIQEEMIKQVVIMQSPSAPWGYMQDIYDKAVIAAKKQQLQNKIGAQTAEGE